LPFSEGSLNSTKERKLGSSESRLNSTPNTSDTNLNVFTWAVRAVAGIGRFVLFLIAILLVTMPFTQHIWTWDHFLRGGQDYETSSLMILTFFCLMLVLAQHCKQSMILLLTAQRRSSLLFPDLLLARTALFGAFPISGPEHVASPRLKTYNLPLQI
jgi:hypothetical protein